MRPLVTLTALCLAFTLSLSAQSKAPEPSKAAAELPVKRVVLYKNGVGYFEHAGRVAGSQELNIQFTTGQLNDVLKSLTVVDLGGGKITGVRYNSIAPHGQFAFKHIEQLPRTLVPMPLLGCSWRHPFFNHVHAIPLQQEPAFATVSPLLML